MQPEKAQLDTLDLYLRKIVSEDKAKALVKRFAGKDEEKAQEAIKLFETRSQVRVQDVERLLGG